MTDKDKDIIEAARKLALTYKWIDDNRILKLISPDLDFAWKIAEGSSYGLMNVINYLADRNLCTHENFRKIVDIAINKSVIAFRAYDLAVKWHLCLDDIIYFKNRTGSDMEVEHSVNLQEPAEIVGYLAMNHLDINVKYYCLNSPQHESCKSLYRVSIQGRENVYMNLNEMLEYKRNEHLHYYAFMQYYVGRGESILDNVHDLNGVRLTEFMLIWRDFAYTVDPEDVPDVLCKVKATLGEFLSVGFTHDHLRHNNYIDPVEYVDTMPSDLEGPFCKKILDELIRRQFTPKDDLMERAFRIMEKNELEGIAADVFALTVFHCDDYLKLD